MMLGVPEGTVKRRLHDMRVRLREMLLELHEEERINRRTQRRRLMIGQCFNAEDAA